VDVTYLKGNLSVILITFFSSILLFSLVVADTFSSNNPTVDGRIVDWNSDDICNGATLARVDSENELTVGAQDNDISSIDCWRAFVEWDITSIPDGSDVTNTVWLSIMERLSVRFILVFCPM